MYIKQKVENIKPEINVNFRKKLNAPCIVLLEEKQT